MLVNEIDADALRQALRRLAKAVVVITTTENGVRQAMAATAVSELSLDPCSMRVCVKKTASIYRMLLGGAPLAINILHHSHEPIARLCSGGAKGEARFETADWLPSDLSLPRLRDAQAAIACRTLNISSMVRMRSSWRVIEVSLHGEADPLVHVDGRYCRLPKGCAHV